MMRSLFAAISGLQNHMTMMDVVGNNIANVNTEGFKSSRVNFEDMLTQNIAGASAPTANRGGTNPEQVGLGMQLGGIQTIQTQGALEATGRNTDFAIQGNGFFIIQNGAQTFYSRDGNFDVSTTGQLINATSGYKVQGWQADAAGNVDTTQPIGAIAIPYGQSVAAQPTANVTVQGNLDSTAADGTAVSTTINVYDSLGAPHPMTLTFTKNIGGTGGWDATVTTTDANLDVSGVAIAPATATFGANGIVTAPDPTTVPPTPLAITGLAMAAGAQGTVADPINIDMTKVTQFAGAGQIGVSSNDGYSAGSLTSFSVGPGGDITGIFSNGTTRPLGQMALALFTNPAGLQRAGANNWQESANSGSPIVGTPDTGGRGAVGTGVLEGSNTDLAHEFTNMVIAQRGFEASSKVISTSDQMLQDLVNLIH
jgi:flagellar hook protein FlgE